MLKQEEAEIGRTVWLRPATKTASRWCHLRLAAEIISFDEWPIVQVYVESARKGAKLLIRVHRLDIALHQTRAKQDKAGDSAHQDHAVVAVGRPAYKPHKPIVLPPGMGEQTLF